MKRDLKNKIMFLLITIVFMLPFVVNAATFKPSMSCPSTADPGAEISCKITATIDDTITGIQGVFSCGGATCTGFEKGKMNFYSADKDGFVAGETGGISAAVGSTSVTVGTLKVKLPEGVSGTYTITVKEVAATDVNYSTIDASNLTQTVTAKVKSNDASLKSLSVEGMTLGPNFSPTNYDYQLMETDKASITITAVANDGGAKISGAGTVNLKYGSNTITIKVTSEAGNSQEYKIKVTRTDTRDTVNTLKSLVVKDYTISPEFKTETKTYSLTVEPTVSKVVIGAELTSDKSSFVKNFGPRTVSLKYGKNAIQVKVKAENEKENVYTINITRTDDRDSNNFLSSISLSDGNINFDKNTTSYTVNVDTSVKEITISAVAESSKAKVTGSGTKTLKDGTNKFEISVKAENETVKKYVVIVNRGASTKPAEDTNKTEETNATTTPEYLKSIIIKNHDFTFDPNIFEYDITIGAGEDKLDILYQSGDGYETTIEGNENLKNGSVVKLIVEKDGDVKVYSFKIKVKEEEKKGGNLLLYIAIGALALVVLGLLLAIFTKKKPTPEEVVRDKFVTEPQSFHNERTITEGVNGAYVTGSMISQVEKPNSMSDMGPSAAPAPAEPVVAPEPAPMEPMPINGPVTNEVAGDFTPNQSVSLEQTPSANNTQSFSMSDPNNMQ